MSRSTNTRREAPTKAATFRNARHAHKCASQASRIPVRDASVSVFNAERHALRPPLMAQASAACARCICIRIPGALKHGLLPRSFAKLLPVAIVKLCARGREATEASGSNNGDGPTLGGPLGLVAPTLGHVWLLPRGPVRGRPVVGSGTNRDRAGGEGETRRPPHISHLHGNGSPRGTGGRGGDKYATAKQRDGKGASVFRPPP